MNMNFNQNNISFDSEDFMFPEVYNIFFPIVDQLIRDMERQRGEIYLTEDLLNQMVEEAIRRSGVDNIPSSANTDETDAVPTINMNMGDFGRGRPGGNRDRDRDRDRDRWRRYDRGALSDLYRILLLQQIFGRRRPRWRWR